jgi:ribonuclease-3
MKELDELEKKLGYSFQDKNLLTQALTHSSYVFEKKEDPFSCNERLEFLGDAVLELVSSEFLYENYPAKPEGELTRIRAALVWEDALFESADEAGIGPFLRLGRGEEKEGGRKKKSVLSDAFEAVIGAMYLDGGIEPARDFIRRFCLKDIRRHVLHHDCKSALQELTQKDGGVLPEYRLVSESGPDHQKEFVVEVLLKGKVLGTGRGSSRKTAEKEAAKEALEKLEENVSEEH